MSIDRNRLAAALEWLGERRPLAAATLVEAEGSSPFEPGATILVDGEGNVEGSVTGGCVESALAQEATAVLGGAEARLADSYLERTQLGPRDAGLVFTHDPKLDQPALVAAVRSGACYVARSAAAARSGIVLRGCARRGCPPRRSTRSLPPAISTSARGPRRRRRSPSSARSWPARTAELENRSRRAGSDPRQSRSRRRSGESARCMM